MIDKENYVVFVSRELEINFENLKENHDLYKNILKAIETLKKDPTSGIKISKKLWAKEYIKKYKITNLWKYNLFNGWRLVYTIKSDQIKIISIIIEWFNHKSYEKRFKY
jgi:Txe/YoeB family toxin of Txe-Axe toxin-antitoxin module